MFRAHTSLPAPLGPVSTDWTIRILLAWIAADDARCHDESLRPVLAAVTDALDPSDGLRPASPIVLVRTLTARLEAEPALRDLRVRDIVARTALSGQPRMREPRRGQPSVVPS